MKSNNYKSSAAKISSPFLLGATGIFVLLITSAFAYQYYESVIIDDPYSYDHALDVSGNVSVGESHTAYSNTRSLMVGQGNSVYAYDSIAVGNDVYVSGQGAAFGSHLINNQAVNATVIGSYNNTDPIYDDAKFVVGNGDATAVSNAFVVYDDGRVVIPTPQGDIPIYTTP